MTEGDANERSGWGPKDREALVTRLLFAATDHLETIADDLDAEFWRLADELFPNSSPWGSHLPEAIARDARLMWMLDLLAALTQLSDFGSAELGSVLWNRGGLLAAAGRPLEAADAYGRAADAFKAQLAAIRSGEVDGDPEDEERWAETSLLHACRNYCRGGHVVAAAAVLRRMNSSDLSAEAREAVVAAAAAKD